MSGALPAPTIKRKSSCCPHPGTRSVDALNCGEALSAILLEYTMAGLSSLPVTHITELESSREMIRDLTAGILGAVPRFDPSRHPTRGRVGSRTDCAAPLERGFGDSPLGPDVALPATQPRAGCHRASVDCSAEEMPDSVGECQACGATDDDAEHSPVHVAAADRALTAPQTLKQPAPAMNVTGDT